MGEEGKEGKQGKQGKQRQFKTQNSKLKTQNSKTQNSKLPTPHSLLPRLFLTTAVFGNAIALILTNSRNAWAIAVFACLAYALTWAGAGCWWVWGERCQCARCSFCTFSSKRLARVILPSVLLGTVD